MLFLKFMSIVDKVQEAEKKRSVPKLTTKQIDFIQTKLRTAQYYGDEFEMFYEVWVVLNEMKEQQK